MADRRRPVPTRESECESEGNPNDELSEYESANEESKGGDGEGEKEDEESSSSSEEGETTDDDEDDDEETDDGEYEDEDVVVEGEYEDGLVVEERQSGDGQEQPELNEDDLDDDEDKKNPAYVPRKGAFYEHDMRIEETEEDAEPKEERPKKKLWKDDGKWLHDRFAENQQAPKSREELIALYGYDIRAYDKPPDRPPKMDRRRGRDQHNELGDFITDRPERYTKSSPPQGRQFENRNRQRNDSSNDDRSRNFRGRNDDEENRQQYNNNRQHNSYQNRQGSNKDSPAGRSYNNLKRGKNDRDNRSNYQAPRRDSDSRNNRGRPDSQQQQDTRFQQQDNSNRKIQERNQRNFRNQETANDRERKGFRDAPNNQGPNRDQRGSDSDQQTPDADRRWPARDSRGPNRGSDRDQRGPERGRRGFGPDQRGPPRNQGGRGPRLQRGGHHGSDDVRNDPRENRRSFTNRPNNSYPMEFTNSALKGKVGEADTNNSEQDKSETIQINVVNKTALLETKSYSRERRGRAVGQTRVQHTEGFDLEKSLPQAQLKEEKALPSRPQAASGNPTAVRDQVYQGSQTPTSPGPQDAPKPFPAGVKQEAGQSRPKRYSTQRQRTLPEAQFPEQSASPVENQAFFNPGFRPPTRMFRPEHPVAAGPRPRQEGPFPPQSAMLRPLPYPVPVSTAGLSSPPRLFQGGPPVSLPAGQPLIPPQYMPTGMIYGAPPYQMPAPVPVQNFSSPPPVAVPVQPPVQLPAQPSPSEVYRGGTTYYAPQLQQTNPNRSPVRRAKLAIPIVRPQAGSGEELSPQYYMTDQQTLQYIEYEEGMYAEGVSDSEQINQSQAYTEHDQYEDDSSSQSRYIGMSEAPPPPEIGTSGDEESKMFKISETVQAMGDNSVASYTNKEVDSEAPPGVESGDLDLAAGGDNKDIPNVKSDKNEQSENIKTLSDVSNETETKSDVGVSTTMTPDSVIAAEEQSVTS